MPTAHGGRRSVPATDAHVLIAGINYAPEAAGIAPYTTGLAEHLVRRGLRVTVLAGLPSHPCWRVFPDYDSRSWLRESRGGVTVYRLRHHLPARPSAIGRGLYEASFLLHGLRGLLLPRPDLVLGVVPAAADGVLARILAARFGVPYGLLFQDLMGLAAEQSGTRGSAGVAQVARLLERWPARHAMAVAAVSPGFFPYLRALGVPESRLMYLPNWTHIVPPTADRRATRQALGWGSGEQVVLHAGNMGVKQALEQVLAAARLAAARQDCTRFVFLGDGNQRAMLEQQARVLVLPNCTFIDPVPDARFSDVLAAADVLLLSERVSVREMSLPSKLTSYFAAGRPVVGVTSADGCTAAELRRAGAGLIVPPEQPAALLEALARLRDDPALGELLAASGRAYTRAQLGETPALRRAEQFIARIAGRVPTSGVALVAGARS
ncbi:MAG: glycosyltransferase [Dehalococcoidia bacterium]